MSDATVRWQAARIAELEEQLRIRDDQIALLQRAELAPTLQLRLRLTPQRARILAALDNSPHSVSYTRLAAMVWASLHTDPADTAQVLKQQVCHLRKQIGRDTIITIHSNGYELSAKGRRVVARALGETQGRAA